MTDNEIVKALECCMGCCCKECPYRDDGAEDCIGKLLVETLKLINRQKAEIERLRKYYFTHDYHECHNEANKEFAEKLKKDIQDHCFEMFMNGMKGTPRTHEITYETVWEYIDNLVKEMTEETKHD